MNAKWIRLAGALLDGAADRASVRGSSDWRWPDDFGPEERRALATAMVARNVHRPPDKFTPDDVADVERLCRGANGPPDWWLMSFLGQSLMTVEADA